MNRILCCLQFYQWPVIPLITYSVASVCLHIINFSQAKSVKNEFMNFCKVYSKHCLHTTLETINVDITLKMTEKKWLNFAILLASSDRKYTYTWLLQRFTRLSTTVTDKHPSECSSSLHTYCFRNLDISQPYKQDCLVIDGGKQPPMNVCV